MDHDPRVVRVDPQVVVVPVDVRDRTEGPASVRRLPGGQIQDINDVAVRRVRGDIREVERPVHELVARVVVDQLPRLPRVVRAVQSLDRLGRLDERIDAVGHVRRHGEVHLADESVRQARRDPPPGVAPVRRLPDPVFLARPRDDRPGTPLGPPHPGINHIGVHWVKLEIHRPHRVRGEEDAFPVEASVRRPIDASRITVPERVPDRCRIDEVGVVRVGLHGTDLARVLEPEVVPRLARVRGLVNALADDDVRADPVRTRPHIDDVGVRVRDFDVADGRRLEVSVGDILPAHPIVRRLPHPTAGRPLIEGVGVGAMALDRRDAAAARGPDEAERQTAEEARVHGVRGRGRSLDADRESALGREGAPGRAVLRGEGRCRDDERPGHEERDENGPCAGNWNGESHGYSWFLSVFLSVGRAVSAP